MTRQPVRFQPVDEIEEAEDEAPDPAPASSAPSEPSAPSKVHDAERDPYPLAGPILEEARARELRGRCSGCDARLRLRLGPERGPPVRVRCPICGRTGQIEA